MKEVSTLNIWLYGVWGSSGSDVFAVGVGGATLHYPVACTVTFDTDPENTGSTTFDGIDYSDGDTASKSAATYTIMANPEAGYAFTAWQTEGDILVGSASSTTTTCNVSGDGTLRMLQQMETPVGGEAYPVNKTALLAPAIAMVALLAGSLIWYVLRRRVV